VLPPGGGVVRIYHVLVSANSRAQTVEELEGRRKRVVAQVLDTLHADVCRAVDAAAKTEEFEKRVSQDMCKHIKDDFINSIKDESAARVAVYKALPDGAYAEIEVVGEAVSKGLALPLLANAKLRLWLEDTSLDLATMGCKEKDPASYLGLDAAQGRRLAQRRLLLLDSSASGRRGSTDRVGRIVVEDGLGRMGGTETAALALEDCHERRLVTGAGAAALERRDPFSGETALIAQVQLGEYENAKRLLQAGADPNAATAGGERALMIAAKAGREDLVELIAGFKADVNVGNAAGRTALHGASKEAVVQVLVKVGANIEAKDNYGWTSLHWASENGHAAVVQTLLQLGTMWPPRLSSLTLLALLGRLKRWQRAGCCTTRLVGDDDARLVLELLEDGHNVPELICALGKHSVDALLPDRQALADAEDARQALGEDVIESSSWRGARGSHSLSFRSTTGSNAATSPRVVAAGTRLHRGRWMARGVWSGLRARRASLHASGSRAT
jgi:hypothetical protein